MCRWGGRYKHFNPPFIPSYEKTKARKAKLDGHPIPDLPCDEYLICPLAHEYDAHIHDAIAQMRTLDGSHVHAKHGPSVNFFAPKGEPKYWVGKKSGPFGFFFYYTLHEVICPALATIFEMEIFHPKTEAAVDELLAATVDL
jgi:hypothetical protein